MKGNDACVSALNLVEATLLRRSYAKSKDPAAGGWRRGGVTVRTGHADGMLRIKVAVDGKGERLVKVSPHGPVDAVLVDALQHAEIEAALG